MFGRKLAKRGGSRFVDLSDCQRAVVVVVVIIININIMAAATSCKQNNAYCSFGLASFRRKLKARPPTPIESALPVCIAPIACNRAPSLLRPSVGLSLHCISSLASSSSGRADGAFPVTGATQPRPNWLHSGAKQTDSAQLCFALLDGCSLRFASRRAAPRCKLYRSRLAGPSSQMDGHRTQIGAN